MYAEISHVGEGILPCPRIILRRLSTLTFVIYNLVTVIIKMEVGVNAGFHIV